MTPTEHASFNVLQITLLTTLLEDASANVSSNPAHMNLSMEHNALAFCNVPLDTSQITALDNASQIVQATPITLPIGNQKHVLVFVHKLTLPSFTLIIKPELVLLTVPLRIMEATETQLSECVCLYAQGCNFPIYQQVIVYQFVPGILIFMASCRTSHVLQNVTHLIHFMLKIKPEPVSKHVLQPLMQITSLKDV